MSAKIKFVKKNSCGKRGLCLEHYGIDLTKKSEIYIEDTASVAKISKSPRVGIRTGTELLWNFKIK
jgi:3-methyladenine DNA glycosylase Mpg